MCSEWKNSLQKMLLSSPEPRIAVMGIGHELRGDDAAALIVVRALQAAVGTRPNVLLVEAGHAPENHTGSIRRFAPNLVLLIDAAHMGELPGTIRWLVWQDTSGISGSSHTLPLHMIAAYLQLELGCEVALIGIQPEGTAFDQPLSDVVQMAVDQIVPPLVEMLRALPS